MPPTFSMGIKGVVSWGQDYPSNFHSVIPLGLDLSNVKKVYSGTTYGLAINNDGTVSGWGIDWRDSGVISDIPKILSDAVSLDVFFSRVIAVRSNGTVAYWGEVPDGLKAFLDQLTDVKMTAYSSNPIRCLVLFNNGKLSIWHEKNIDHASSKIPDNLTGIVSIYALASNFNVALKRDGRVIHWGSNHYKIAEFINNLVDVKSISVSPHHIVALKQNGEIVEWGRGRGWLEGIPQPPNLNELVSIDSGNSVSHDIALRKDGTVVVWGLDNGGYPIPPPKWLHGVTDISVGSFGNNLVVAPTRSIRVLQDSGPQNFEKFVFDISPGSGNESNQKISFEVSYDNPDLFEHPPVVNSNGNLTFSIENKKTGQSDITVVAIDDGGTSEDGPKRSKPRTVELFVVPDETTPSALGDEYDIWQEHVLHANFAGGVLMNDLSTKPSTMKATLVKEPTHGKIEFREHGNFCYWPDEGFIGADHFTYRFNDEAGVSNDAKVAINIIELKPIPSTTLELTNVFVSGGRTIVNYQYRIDKEYIYYVDHTNSLNRPWNLSQVPGLGSWKTKSHQLIFQNSDPIISKGFIRFRVDYNRGGCRSN